MNHIFIGLRALLKALDMVFHIVQGKPKLAKKKVPLLLVVARV